VAAVGVARGVGVVLEQVDDPSDPLFPEPLLGGADEPFQDPLSRLVVRDEVAEGVALRRGVLGMAADVEIEAGPVLEEDVRRATPAHDPAEEVARHLVRTEAPLPSQRAGHAVLVLEAEDPSLHSATT